MTGQTNPAPVTRGNESSQCGHRGRSLWAVAAAPSRRPAAPGFSPKTPPPGSSRPRAAGDAQCDALRVPDVICPSQPVPPPTPPGTRGRSARRRAPGSSPPRGRTARVPLPPPGRRRPKRPRPLRAARQGRGRTPPRSISGRRPALTGPTAAATATGPASPSAAAAQSFRAPR